QRGRGSTPPGSSRRDPATGAVSGCPAPGGTDNCPERPRERVPARGAWPYAGTMQTFLRTACAVNGFLGVALGAFGAHGLKARLADVPDAAGGLRLGAAAAAPTLF